MTPEHQPKSQEDEIAELQEKLATQESLAALGLAWAALQHRLHNTFNILLPQITRLKRRIRQNDPETMEIVEILERSINHHAVTLSRLDLLMPSSLSERGLLSNPDLR